MSWFSQGEKTTTYLGLIALGSGGASLAVVDSNSRRIIFSATKTFATRATDNLEAFLTEAAEAIKAVAGNLPDTLPGKPKTYTIILPAPLFVAAKKETIIEQAEPFVVNRSKIADLNQAALNDFLSKEPLLFSQLAGDSNVLIENQALGLNLNGYPFTGKPNQKVTSLHYDQYLSLGSKQVLTRLADAVKVATNINQIKFQTFPYTAYRALDQLLGENRDDYLILDASGELTDIIVVHNRCFSTHFSFPYGLNFLLKKIATAAGTTVAEASSSLELYYEGKLEAGARDRLTDLLLAERKVWLDYFLQAFKKISETSFIFPDIYFLGDNFGNFFFREFFRDESLEGLVINRDNFRLSTAASLLNLSAEELRIDSSANILLLLEALFLTSPKK